MPRPQFTLRALLVAMLVVGAFCGGMAVQRALDDWKYEGYKQWLEKVNWKEKVADGIGP